MCSLVHVAKAAFVCKGRRGPTKTTQAVSHNSKSPMLIDIFCTTAVVQNRKVTWECLRVYIKRGFSASGLVIARGLRGKLSEAEG